MNRFYHEFTPGFNWWYVVLAAFFLVSVVYGHHEWFSTRAAVWKFHGRRVRVNDIHSKYENLTAFSKKNKGMHYLIFAETAVLTVMMFAESFSGVIQFFDNHSGASDPTGVWSVLIAFNAILTVALIECALLHFGVWFGALLRVLQFGGEITLYRIAILIGERRKKKLNRIKEFDNVIPITSYYYRGNRNHG